MISNMFYFANINSIGGVETFFYNLARVYGDSHNIVVYYKTGDPHQVARLMRHVQVVKYSGERIKCKKAFFNYTLDILDHVDAEEYIQIIHADFKAQGIKPNTNPRINRYLGVSRVACKSFTELTGIKCELALNPYFRESPRPVLSLISATRLTPEKGKKRMERFAEILDRNGIRYIWMIFTNDKQAIKNPNIIYRNPTLDILDYIAKADYLVQLSDNEAYCYSVVEALCAGTPVIVTKCPVFDEIGVKNGENGFIVDFDLHDIPIDEIVNRAGERVPYTPLADQWNDILVPGESHYKEELGDSVVVRVKRNYHDIPLNKEYTRGEIVAIPISRLENCLNADVIEFV